MPRLRQVAVLLAVVAAVAGIAGVAVALPSGSSGKSVAEQAPATSVPAGADANSGNLAQGAQARQAALNAQRARFYAGVYHAQQVRFYAGVNHTLQVRARQAQQARFYAGVAHTLQVRFYQGVYRAMVDRWIAGIQRGAAIQRWVAGLQRGKAWGAAIARWEAGIQRGNQIARWVAGVQRGKAWGAAIARWEAGLHRAPSGGGSSSVGSGACGGDLPSCCILQHESGGNPTAMNPSGAAGKWQFMPGTWAGYGGYASAAQAPVAVQDARARQVWAGGAGASNWAGDGC